MEVRFSLLFAPVAGLVVSVAFSHSSFIHAVSSLLEVKVEQLTRSIVCENMIMGVESLTLASPAY